MRFRILACIVFCVALVFLCRFIYNNYSVVRRCSIGNVCQNSNVASKIRDSSRIKLCNRVNVAIFHNVFVSDDDMYEYNNNVYHKKFFKRILTSQGVINVLVCGFDVDKNFNSPEHFDISDSNNDQKPLVNYNVLDDDFCDKKYIIVDTDDCKSNSIKYFDKIY